MSIANSYKITKRLGEQHRRKFGELFLAEHKETGAQVVLKAVRKTPENRHIAQRLIHEAQFSFDMEGLPKVLDFYESETEVLMVRKYVEGTPVDQYWNQLKKKERYPFLVNFIESMGVLFQELNARQVVHCDIKPGNILIRENGTHVELIDFGLALHRTAPDDRDILFPLGFAAPELLLNHLDLVDQTTDIYALGIVLWRLFTGKLPLTHPNPSIFTNLQLTHPLPDAPEIPKQLFPVLQKMTEKHQFKLPPNKLPESEVKQSLKEAMQRRYQNLEAVSEDLKHISFGRGILPKNLFSKS